MPPPVLVGTVRAATALVEDLGPDGQQLIDEFWPGGLTIVCRAARTLSWDLGDTKGTVAIRMPEDAVALDLLRETGPMAVSSANLTGLPPRRRRRRPGISSGDAVSVYLDNGTVLRRRGLDHRGPDRAAAPAAAPRRGLGRQAPRGRGRGGGSRRGLAVSGPRWPASHAPAMRLLPSARRHAGISRGSQAGALQWP